MEAVIHCHHAFLKIKAKIISCLFDLLAIREVNLNCLYPKIVQACFEILGIV